MGRGGAALRTARDDVRHLARRPLLLPDAGRRRRGGCRARTQRRRRGPGRTRRAPTGRGAGLRRRGRGVVMDARVLTAAVLAGVATAAASGRVVHVTRRLAPATRPYSQLARSRLGRPADVTLVAGAGPAVSGRTVARVFGPIAASCLSLVARVVDVADDNEVAPRLRQAGFYELSVADYRIRQFGWAVGSAVVAGVAGAV